VQEKELHSPADFTAFQSDLPGSPEPISFLWPLDLTA
jgi:hypothetical protein